MTKPDPAFTNTDSRDPLNPLHQTISERDTMEQSIAYVIMLENPGDNHSKKIYGDRIKILKTIYLADMYMMEEIEHPINTGETYSALKHGMVPNKVYGIITGNYKTTEQIKPVKPLKKHKVYLDRTKGYIKTEDDLDMLSEQEKAYIKRAYDEIKDKDFDEINDMFHNKEKFPEYQNPSDSIKNAKVQTLLQVYAARLGVSEEEVAEVVYEAQS